MVSISDWRPEQLTIRQFLFVGRNSLLGEELVLHK